MHKGSKETYDYIADWIDPSFFFSKKDKWDRMGLLGVFGDYIVSSVGGSILDIGVGESSLYLSHVARKYGRRIHHCDIAADKIINPLTVTCYLVGESLPFDAEQLFKETDHITFKNSEFYHMTSDKMFEKIQNEELCLAFIDGDHVYAQAKKDFENALALVVDHGFIILHDTYPPSEEYLCPNSKCGDVYKLRQELQSDPRVDTLTLTRGCAMGVGFTICRKRPAKLEYFHE